MYRSPVHTVYKHGMWLNELSGGQEFPNRYVTKEGAIAGGEIEARRRRCEHVIHNLDGSVRERNSYAGEDA